jgi:hypothetical protein
MRVLLKVLLVSISLLFSNALKAKTGDVRIVTGKTQIALNQAFTIKIIVENEYIKSYSDFPDIKGFQKRGTSSSTNTSIVNGKMSVETSITQTYVPTAEGDFVLNPFEMTINGKKAQGKGANIKVGPPVKVNRRRDPFAWDPFDEFFGDGRKEIEYVDVKADAFFAITTDKKEVYRGEGFNLTIAFYVAENNRAQMRFPGDIGNQLNDIVKKIKPSNVWEENFGVSEIVRKPVTLNGKNYDQYILFQSSYFPLNEDDISIPSASLRLIKYKEAKTRSFFGSPRQEDDAIFKSRAKKIRVKPLPDHPLKELVSVGRYKLDENINAKDLKTGNSFDYTFKIIGEGNIAGIQNLPAPQDENFDFYSPNIAQNIRRANNTVRGFKEFNFYAIPKEPGNYDLAEYFQWVFFDPARERYDTLRSEIKVEITGESQKNSYILSNDMGTFYDMMEFQDNTLKPREKSLFPKIIYLTLLTIVLVASFYVYFKK